LKESTAPWLHHRASGIEAIFAILTAIGIAAVGAGFAIFVVGLKVVNPFDVSWFIIDAANSYLGWEFFRNEAHLNFPLGWSSAIGFPIGEAVAYLDSIPLVATILWPVRQILPPDFQYQGLFFAANCSLQLYFGYRICRRFSGHNRLAGIAGGVLFMTAPPFVFRSIGHFSLTGQWLLLAAIEIFLAASPQIWKSASIKSVILCLLAGGIHPYLAVMVLLILGAASLRALLFAGQNDNPPLKSRIFHSAFWFCTSVAAAGASLTIFGFLRLDDLGPYPSGGYGYHSMNLLAPLDPWSFGILPQLPNVAVGQYEGYNYLGLGVILLGIVAVALRPSAARKLLARDAIAMWVIIGVSLFFALSTKATAGSLILYDLPTPQWIFDILSTFRASGRLFWPAYYLILAGIIAAACGVFKGRKLTLALSVVLLIQFADLRGLYAAIHNRWQHASSSAFTDGPPWQTLGYDHRHLVVIPPWQCNPVQTPGGARGFWIFGNLAAHQNMTINSFYGARPSMKQQAFFCNQQAVSLGQNGLDENTAYVFTNMAAVQSLNLRGHYCRLVDGVILCSIGGAR
jgi:hypothetical protein